MVPAGGPNSTDGERKGWNVQIPFEIGDRELILHWHSGKNHFTLALEDRVESVNTWWHPRQQLGFHRRRVWIHELDGHRIEIVKVRPRILPFARSNEISVWVDGEFAAREIGT